ncbi:hypothetical protein B5M10_03355 [Pluralibacter gergoviae]|nr:hypothetical protein SS31_00880 [Pluralibacter gergoviae]OUR04085.1 hypothetical protein B5M10_03355 [Pluralibacter gergoviae]
MYQAEPLEEVDESRARLASDESLRPKLFPEVLPAWRTHFIFPGMPVTASDYALVSLSQPREYISH